MTRFLVTSVPHTGTQTTEMLLTVLGVTFMRIHTGQGLPKTPGGKIIIPQRDPGNVWLTHYRRHRGNDYPSGQPRSDDVAWMYGELAEWRTRFPSITYPVDMPVPPTYWDELAQFLEINPEDIFSGDVLSFVHAGHKYGSTLRRRAAPVELPQWVQDLRYEWGYTEPFNPSGYIAVPLVEGYGPPDAQLSGLR